MAKRRPPFNFQITIRVLPNGNFNYKLDQGTGDPANLALQEQDTVQWRLYLKGKPAPFNIEFPNFSPFGLAGFIIRSFGGYTTAQTVSVSDLALKHLNNLSMKYNVNLTNGWSDDPDIVYVPSDGLLPKPLTVNPAILLSYNDTGVVIEPNSAALMPGIVTWKWKDSVPVGDRDDFVVKFDPKVTEWPQTLSSNGTKQIVYNFPAALGDNHPYTITTNTFNLVGNGYLTVH